MLGISDGFAFELGRVLAAVAVWVVCVGGFVVFCGGLVAVVKLRERWSRRTVR